MSAAARGPGKEAALISELDSRWRYSFKTPFSTTTRPSTVTVLPGRCALSPKETVLLPPAPGVVSESHRNHPRLNPIAQLTRYRNTEVWVDPEINETE